MRSAILRTLCYADIFDFPLTLGETHQYLIHHRPASLSQVTIALTKLTNAGLIHSRQGSGVGDLGLQFSLKGRQKIFSIRHRRQKLSQQKAKITQRVGQWLKKIPSLKALYITGALAMGNADKNDDIDLMIVTSSGQLWTTRLFSTILLDLLRVRRKPGPRAPHQNPTNKLCPNLYLDSQSLNLKPFQRNLYTAHEVAQAKLVWQKDQTHRKFLYSNRWISQFLPNTSLPTKPLPANSAHNHPFSNLVESLSYQFQAQYMSHYKTSEVVTKHTAFFHPRDTKALVLGKYLERLKKHKLKPLHA